MPAERFTVEGLRSGASPARDRGAWWLSPLFLSMGVATLLVLMAILLAVQSRSRVLEQSHVPSPLNLNEVQKAHDLLAVLDAFPNPSERRYVAERLFQYLEQNRPLTRVGQIAGVRFREPDLSQAPAQGQLLRRWKERSEGLTGEAIQRLSFQMVPPRSIKPLVSVRSWGGFTKAAFFSALLYFGVFWGVAALWWLANYRGDPLFLPALHLLTGIGFVLMIVAGDTDGLGSPRDPLRDSLLFQGYANGVALGLSFLCLPVIHRYIHWIDYRRLIRSSLLALSGAALLFAGLLFFGQGPGTSDARISLFGVQPVEFIKVLMVVFLASYLHDRWQGLRETRESRGIFGSFPHWMRPPGLQHVWPVAGAVLASAAALAVVRDMGPALILTGLFLVLYGVARRGFVLPVMGAAGVALVAWVFYAAGISQTIRTRVEMWLDPWNTPLRGGNHVAHSLWAFASGGFWGTGIGWGTPSLVTASHTDFVFSAIGEEMGWLGVATVFLLLGFLCWRGVQAALRAPSDFGFFLAFGAVSLFAIQTLVIAGGVLAVLPLTGVVTPFVSYGKSSMLANLLLIGLICLVSEQSAEASNLSAAPASNRAFALPAWAATGVLAAGGALILGYAAWVQVFGDAEVIGKTAQTYEEDRVVRPRLNPRFLRVAARIPRGDIVDRNGLILATNNPARLRAQREQWSQAGISLENCCRPADPRHYTLGGITAHLLGDDRTEANYGAPNSSLVERDEHLRLRGFRSYSELLPLLRQRDEESDVWREILARDKTLKLTLDARLQERTAAYLREGAAKANSKKGAAIVLDASTGAILASVNLPWPEGQRVAPPQGKGDAEGPLLDRARFGEFPPGSIFKLVTAMAALRKDPQQARNARYSCVPLGGGRVGAVVRRQPVRDFEGDQAHGSVGLEKAIVVSCNAFFAQFALKEAGDEALAETAALFDIPVDNPRTRYTLRDLLHQAGFGQGEVTVRPIRMARVAATIANQGLAPFPYLVDVPEPPLAPARVLDPLEAAFLAQAMRQVVTSGTARAALAGSAPPIAGKTGTAQAPKGPDHAWFVGYAPHRPAEKRIAFAVLVEGGGPGGRTAAPIAGRIVRAARELGLIGQQQQ